METTKVLTGICASRPFSWIRKPGDDVLVVSIGGTRDALQAIIDGKMGVTVESSLFFGPLACEVMTRSNRLPWPAMTCVAAG